MEYKKESVVQRAVYKLDRFGIPMNLNFNGKRTYQSNLGFALTIIQITIVLVYLGFQINTVNNRSDIKIYSSENFLGNDLNRKANISSKDFGISYRIQYYGSNVSWQGDEVYTLFSPQFTNDFLNGTRIDQPFKITPPDSKTFLTANYPGASAIVWTGDGAIITTQASLKGILRLEIFFCQQSLLDMLFPGKKCKSEQESFDAISGVQIYIEQTYQYFDSTNFTEPLKWKSFMEIFGLSKSFSHAKSAALRERNLKLGDSLWNSDFGSESKTFYTMPPSQSYYVNDLTYKKRMVSYNILLDQSTENTTREVRNYAQAVSAVGGLLGILTVLNLALVNFFVRSKLDVDLISSSFRQNHLSSESLKSNTESLKSLFIRQQGQILTLKESIFLKFTALCPLIRTHRFQNKHKIYERAMDKIAQEISIQNLIKISRMTKLLAKILLPQKLRVISKQLLFKEISTEEKYKWPKRPTLEDQDIKKLFNKKSSIYKRFLKYALGSQDDSHGDMFPSDGENRFGDIETHRKERQKHKHSKPEEKQYKHQQESGLPIQSDSLVMPVFPFKLDKVALHKNKRSSRKEHLETGKGEKKKSHRHQYPELDQYTDDQEHTLRKLKQ